MALKTYLSKIKANNTTFAWCEVNTSTFSLKYPLHVTFSLRIGCFNPSRPRDSKKYKVNYWRGP